MPRQSPAVSSLLCSVTLSDKSIVSSGVFWSCSGGSVHLRQPYPLLFSLPTCPLTCRDHDSIQEGVIHPHLGAPYVHPDSETWLAILQRTWLGGLRTQQGLEHNADAHRASRTRAPKRSTQPPRAAYDFPPPSARCDPCGCPPSSLCRHGSSCGGHPF